MWLIVGLGNPGPKYELTRHNFGFLAADFMLEKAGISGLKRDFGSDCARFFFGGEPCLLIKPQSFMNRSGQSVQQAMTFYKIALDKVIVMHDELDLPLGELRIKKGGGDGGHNGLKDITRLLGPDYLRVRLGIGRPSFKGTEADFVLANFRDDEIKIVEEILPKAHLAAASIITDGLEKAQANFQIKSQKNK